MPFCSSLEITVRPVPIPNAFIHIRKHLQHVLYVLERSQVHHQFAMYDSDDTKIEHGVPFKNVTTDADLEQYSSTLTDNFSLFHMRLMPEVVQL